MRVMMIMFPGPNAETGVLPEEKSLTEMGKFNEEMVKAGVLLADRWAAFPDPPEHAASTIINATPIAIQRITAFLPRVDPGPAPLVRPVPRAC